MRSSYQSERVCCFAPLHRRWIRFLVNIGANVVVEKSREDATKFMEGRAKEVEESLASIISQRNQVAQRLDSDRRAAQTILNRQGQ